MGVTMTLLSLISAFSATIMVSRRVDSAARAYPLGIVVGIIVFATLFFLSMSLVTLPILMAPTGPLFTE